MRIERCDDRRPVSRFGMPGRSGDDRLVAQVNAIEHTDGKEERAGEVGEFADGVEDFHGENDE